MASSDHNKLGTITQWLAACSSTLTVTMVIFADEIRKSAGNAGIKTFTSKLDQGLMADAVTRGELKYICVLHFQFSRQLYILVWKMILAFRFFFYNVSMFYQQFIGQWDWISDILKGCLRLSLSPCLVVPWLGSSLSPCLVVSCLGSSLSHNVSCSVIFLYQIILWCINYNRVL